VIAALLNGLNRSDYGHSPVEAATFAAAAALLAVAALFATYIPARRAAVIAPMETLRGE
jgi:ABC-type lipoprotein release transport system permease subunit